MSSRESFSHGEPVTVEIKLSLDGSRPAAEAMRAQLHAQSRQVS
ncbi:hypothetical protein [Nonomuraea sp. NPDC050783]